MSRDPIVWLAYVLSGLTPGPIRKHFADCVSYACVFRVFAPNLPPLRLKHVLGIVALPSTAAANVAVHPVMERVKQLNHGLDRNRIGRQSFGLALVVEDAPADVSV